MDKYQMCEKCVMDTSDTLITFNEDGVCNHCIEAEKILETVTYTHEEEQQNLEALVQTIKKSAKGKYDSIVGVSGGVDSSYVVHLAFELGLNPLIVHFDNGWNSETSVSNIEKLINKTGFDLETYVIDWAEFKDLQRSFLKAGVIDIEMLSDHAIMATMFAITRKKRIRNVLSGTNHRTEFGLPESWVWHKQDFKNIKSIQQRFGSKKIKSFPSLNTVQMNLIKIFGLGGKYLEPLNMINYEKNKAMEILTKNYDWKYYGGKHYESTFTKFYQAYILPTKFGIDKRKVHLSSLIRNGEITKEYAISELDKELYDSKQLRIDKEYVLKKLGFSSTEFDEIMKEQPRSHMDFPSERIFIEFLKKLLNRFNLSSLYSK